MAHPTLLDIAVMSGGDALVGLIDETIKPHPELTLGEARTIRGQMYRTLVRTSVPSGDFFRHAHQGRLPGKCGYELRLVETFILDLPWQCDKAVADRAEEGAAAYIAKEALAIVEAGMQDLATQFYYGRDATFGNTKGFPGLLEAYDRDNMEVDAGGTTDNVASSVWAVKFGPKAVRWVWGKEGELTMGDVRLEEVEDDDDPQKTYTAYVQGLLAYPGLQVGSLHSVARIKNLTTDSGKTLTDALIADLLMKFPANTKPDALLMSRRSCFQLQQSRTAVNEKGEPAPFPEEAFEVPIERTDSIVNTETLTL